MVLMQISMHNIMTFNRLLGDGRAPICGPHRQNNTVASSSCQSPEKGCRTVHDRIQHIRQQLHSYSHRQVEVAASATPGRQHSSLPLQQLDSCKQTALGRLQAQSSSAFRQRSLPICYTAVPHRVGSEADLTDIEGRRNDAAWRSFYSFFKFSRPHTVLGTFVSIVSVSLLALGPQDIGWRSLRGLLQALIPALLMNIHIVGLNQIFDIDIDKVNKPYLPLASGEFSMQTAVAIVSSCGLAALTIGVLVGSLPLMATLVGSAALGVAYSVDLPFLRWKQHPVASAACILAVRAVLVQLGFYFHMKQVLGQSQLVLTRPLVFTIAFMLFFSVVIAFFKDIPDVEGDKQAGVRTFSVRQGTARMFWTCICLLEVAYGGAIVAGLASEVLWSKVATVVAHAAMGLLLYGRARQTDVHQSKSIYSCYMFVWKLFYAEYLLIPLLR